MTETSAILELQGIEKIYGTEKNPIPVLRGISFSVERGEHIAIVGPSGSGKSTLLNILGCLDKPTSGSYRLAGEDVARFDDRALSRIRNTRIGFIFQSFHLISQLTVIENVEMPLFYARVKKKERRRKAMELIEKVGLGHRVKHRPSELSGGECQRTAIARALTTAPAMLLADEPTGNLDSVTTKAILGVLRELNEAGHTIVMITHDGDIARSAPRRVALRDGLVESDSGTARRMMLFELSGDALLNLGRHKLRSFLTALGIIFGIASVVLMVGVGEGARRAILQQISELGIKNIIVNAKKPPEEQNTKKASNDWVMRYGLTFHDQKQIEETVPSVEQVLPVHDVKKWIWFKSRRIEAKVRGVNPDYFEKLHLKPILGRALTDTDGARRKRVCVIRARLLREAKYVGDPLALDLRVGTQYFHVVGVLPDFEFQSPNKMVLGIDDRALEIYVPFQTVVDRYGLNSSTSRQGTYENERVEVHQLVCSVKSEDKVMEAARCIQAILAKLHKKRDFEVTVPLEQLEQREKAQQVFNYVLPVIAGISLLVGGIGILNIMLASITERTREIGIRRALGASRSDIVMQFLVETVVISTIGGLLGVAVGVGGAPLMSKATGWETTVTPWAIGLSLTISMLTGIIFGLYPARRAAYMDPIEALRHE